VQLINIYSDCQVEKYLKGYVLFPLELKSIVIGNNYYKEALEDSIINFYIKTFGINYLIKWEM